MDEYSKNALWNYWRNGNDEEVITDSELSNPRDDNLIEENEIAQIFRIDTNFFDFNTPQCQAFKELMRNIKMIGSMSGTKEDGYCNTGDLPGFIREGSFIHCEYYEWYNTIEDSELKEEALINKRILEESMKMMEESSEDKWDHDWPVDEWKDYEHTTYIKTDVSSNQNTYNNEISKEKIKEKEDAKLLGIFYVKPPHASEGRKPKPTSLGGASCVKPPTCKTEKFEVVKYSFETAEDIFHKKNEGWFISRTK
ncbi:hypothetical protein Tco_0280904 [Tanacetum coccineum]